ncbi:DUF4254 domain-containing protein [Nocardia halotolerans]|uniref:DUF4254 domain-containing protein n=1 Tax=Nocardia halotolerans TaxID=1755878 RepID=A0ABV8VMW7_9NOCA
MPINTGHLAPLPSPSALLRAFVEAGEPGPTRHRVLDAAAGLARCHDRRRTVLDGAPGHHLDDIDAERAALIARIDDWVTTHVAHRAGASLHTETLGAVIDRMAAKWIAAQRALGGDPEGRTHLQWCRLAELTDGYRDLITDVTEHRRRLPVW